MHAQQNAASDEVGQVPAGGAVRDRKN